MLKMTGHWGTGAHSAIDVQEVHVLNLGQPPAEDDSVDGTFLAGQAFVPEIVEDVEPEPGLDVPLGNCRLTQNDGRMEIVYDPERS
jgi:hypothetical protein